MSDVPSSLIELQRRFTDDAACARYLVALRWPDGFRCPRCAHDHAWMLETKARTYECARCGTQTSVTAGTFMHGSKVARKLLSLGSYKAAWLLCANLRRAMIDPTRSAVRRRRLG